MVMSRRTIIAIVTIVSCYFVSNTHQLWKSHKPYAWDGPPKYLHSIVIKSPPPPPPPSAIYLSSDEKPFKPPNNCDLRKVVFTQSAESPQVYYKNENFVVPMALKLLPFLFSTSTLEYSEHFI